MLRNNAHSLVCSPTSAHSRRAVVKLGALSLDDKTFRIVRYARRDLGNLVRSTMMPLVLNILSCMRFFCRRDTDTSEAADTVVLCISCAAAAHGGGRPRRGAERPGGCYRGSSNTDCRHLHCGAAFSGATRKPWAIMRMLAAAMVLAAVL